MKSKICTVVVVLTALSLIMGCKPAPTPTPKPKATPTPVPPTPTPPPKPIKIALLAPLSGPVKVYGEGSKNAFMMAVEEWNAKGGILGRKIEPVIGDTKCDAKEATDVGNKVIFEDKVKFIVGALCSSASIPISEIAESSKVLQISHGSTNPQVTINPDGSNKEYVFRICYLDPFQGMVDARFARDDLGAKTAAALYDVGNDYVKGLAEYFKSAFEELGGKVVVFEAYTEADTDFSAILTKVAEAEPDILFLPDYYPKDNLIAAQAKEKGITATFLGTDGWAGELDMELFEGGYHSNHYSPADPRPIVQDFITTYEEKFGEIPNAPAVLAYDAANVLFSAIEKAGSDDSTAVKDVLAKSKFESITGEISFDEHGDPIKKAAINKIEGGKRVFVKFVAP
ncbi:MAG: ABC transporter substrate-binding protein [Chloroflexota bacterium]|nr:ABC transporter substrate-binding protein [Chloroflexota bacterium]